MNTFLKGTLLTAALLIGFGVSTPVFAQEKGDVKGAEEGKKEAPAEGKKIELPWKLEDMKKSVKKGGFSKLKMVMNMPAMGMSETSYQRMEYTAVDDKGYTTKTTKYDAENKETESEEETKTWEDFAKEFTDEMGMTEENTTVSDAKVKVAAGEFDCKVYTMKKTDENMGGMEMTMKIYLVKDKPGAIAKMEMSVPDFMDMTMELVEWSAGS